MTVTYDGTRTSFQTDTWVWTGVVSGSVGLSLPGALAAGNYTQGSTGADWDILVSNDAGTTYEAKNPTGKFTFSLTDPGIAAGGIVTGAHGHGIASLPRTAGYGNGSATVHWRF